MKAMDLERQRWQEYLNRKQQETEIAERREKVKKMNQQKQTVFDPSEFDALKSDAGYKGYRLKLDEFDCEWEVQQYTQGWGWNRIDSLGFHQGQSTIYKTLRGACNRVKKELGA